MPRSDATADDPGTRTTSSGAPTVGIVGAGQLARMLCEKASELGIHTVVLAEHPHQDSATPIAHHTIPGTPHDPDAMARLAETTDVITLDHEQVDVELLRALVATGVTVYPPITTIEMAVDKRIMRTRLAAAGLPVPDFAIIHPVDSPTPTAAASIPATAASTLTLDDTVEAVEKFAAHHSWPVVIKAARGGYDGHGVWPVADATEARAVCAEARANGIPLLVEVLVPIDAELAVLTARRPGGQMVVWPTVETAQVDGVCREILIPGRLEPALVDAAADLGRAVAGVAASVGVLAVELFWSGGRLLVNEVAARPHNSGHWTIEGAVTSQFENHLRAVLDLPLGDTATTAPAVATVNVFGSTPSVSPAAADGPEQPGQGVDPAEWLDGALEVPGAHIHLYGKRVRPRRKLGHVTVCGSSPGDVRARAWQAACALGTPIPAGLDIPARPSDPNVSQ